MVRLIAPVSAAVLASIILLTGCSRNTDEQVITLWHQMTVGERRVLDEEVARFESVFTRMFG